MIDGFSTFFALLTAVLTIVSTLLAPAEMRMAMTRFVDGPIALAFLGGWTLGSLPIAFAMPRVRAAFFGRMRRLPSRAYVIPRWVIRLALGGAIGQVAGYCVLAVLLDRRLFWLAGAMALNTVALWAGARPRLKGRVEAEFVMPWCWRPWR